ncbi:MAG: PAS domain-containing sensor histidine kinase [Gammaproteobacteria bacterium]
MDIKDYIIKYTAGNLYWKDQNSIYLGCNDNMAKIFKLNSCEDVIGKSDYDFNLEAQLVKKIIKNDQLVLSSGKEEIFEEIGANPEGKLAVYLTKKIPLKNSNNEIVGVVGTSIDITERKLAEKREKRALVQAAEAKAKADGEVELRNAIAVLAGSIAHDLRTPIASLEMNAKHIIRFWPVLIEAYRKAKAAQLSIEGDDWVLECNLPLIAQVGKTFEEITQEMQEFIRVTLKTLSRAARSELMQQDLTPCSIWHCIHSTLQRYPFTEEDHKLIRWEQHSNFEFMGNSVLIIRILFNLLNNALQQIKKNQHGEILISTEEGGEVNILRFKDTAGGAPPEVIDHLFDGYHTTKEKGTGVGLAFCKLTMKSFGGDIVCRSVSGDYMEFLLTFPQLPEKTQDKSHGIKHNS